ncbi:MAG: rubrerythrin family protein [Chloroflexi bacterium]|nr:rubrerythrin family protein [Chloroflexota bacterium]
MGKTGDNLQSAFAGESQANRKYLFFAEKAEQEGQKQVARLFRAAAEAETVHARNHLRTMQAIKSTEHNLMAAVAGENHEFTEMYPDFIRQAETDKDAAAKRSFDLANQAEQTHHGLFQKALAALQKGSAQKDQPFYVCQVCGHTAESTAPEKCPVCGAQQKMFKRVD